MKNLAIVIPAYKPDFFLQALQSIENQTDRNYQLYIGDDCGSSDLWKISAPFCEKNGWVYHRFNKNLGQTDLVAHWKRSVRLSSEPWVWMFSDDDLMEPDCVENFYKTVSKNPHNAVFKFNLQVVNERNEIVETNFPIPDCLSAFDFGHLRFNRKLFSSAVEFVFRRSVFDEQDGFVNFPSAWNSDDASWIAFTGSKCIVTIDKGLVSWRMSKTNISSKGGEFSQVKIDASVQYMVWFNQRFGALVTPVFFAEQIIWLRLQMVHSNYQPDLMSVVKILSNLKIPFSSFWLRAFDDLYCLSYVYRKKVVLKETPKGWRNFLHQFLPKF